MSRDGLYAVGEVARRTGLTTKALRHYDRLGLLVPAEVGPDGYRWYDESQVGTARRIARLRALDVPLEAVRALLGEPDTEAARRLLTRHRTALQARDDRIRRSLHALDHLLSDERGIPMALDTPPAVPVTDERALAVWLFNETWSLLEKEVRTPAEDDRMVHMAHASRFHWDDVGDDQNRAIGEWQVSRVYASLDRGEPAVWHARRAVEYAETAGVDDWMRASAQEGLARALLGAGDAEGAREARDRAAALLEQVDDAEDRAVVAADLDTLALT